MCFTVKKWGKEMPMEIGSKTIKGNIIHKIANYINLSSCPKQYATIMVTRIASTPMSVMFNPITPPLMFNIKTNRFVHARSTNKPVIVLLDNDNKFNNLLIKSINLYTDMVVVEKITFIKEVSTTAISGRVGASRSMCNFHHTDETHNAMGCTMQPITTPSDILTVMVNKTKGTINDSIAGLTVTLNYIGVPFQVVVRGMISSKSWMLLKPDEMGTKYTLAKMHANTFGSVNTKKQWRSLLGYTNYITTEKGEKEIITKNNTVKENKIRKMLWDFIQTVVQFFAWIWMKLKQLLTSKVKTKTKIKNQETIKLKKREKKNGKNVR